MKKTTPAQKREAAYAAYRKAADDHLIAVRGLPTFRAVEQAERVYLNAFMRALNAANKTEKVKS